MTDQIKPIIFAVIAAGIGGTIANAAAAAVIIGPHKFALALVPGRYLVAIACAAMLPFIYNALKSSQAYPFALIALTAVPSLLAKGVLGAAAPWTMVLSLNAVYALAAIAVYQGIRAMR